MYNPADTAVAHNLGAMHPFYDEEIVKQGQIGGLMDYGLYEVGTIITPNHNYSYHSSMLTHIEHATWAGAVQFGPFNRLRMCPVLEVRSLLAFIACVLFRPVGKSMVTLTATCWRFN